MIFFSDLIWPDIRCSTPFVGLNFVNFKIAYEFGSSLTISYGDHVTNLDDFNHCFGSAIFLNFIE